MTERDALKLALEALEKTTSNNHSFAEKVQLQADAITALRERLAQPEMQPCAERKVIMDSLQKQADLATDALDRRWALEMIAAVAARSSK